MSQATAAARPDDPGAPADAVRRSPRQHARARQVGLWPALRWEVSKLATQWRARATLLGALLGPIPIVMVVNAQTRPPKDTLFGRFAIDNGFALALLILGFASQWVLPLLTSIVAGDIFASEDHHGTWKTVLTRSVSRSSLFWAKVITACGFATLVLAVLAASAITASLVLVGHQPLVGLSGQTIDSAQALRVVTLSWASMIAPTLGFTCLAMLLSIATRNPAAGIAAPVIIAMVMQLVGTLGGIEAARPLLLTTAFESWHGLTASPHFTGPLIHGFVVAAVWSALCLAVGFVLLRRRDITGG